MMSADSLVAEIDFGAEPELRNEIARTQRVRQDIAELGATRWCPPPPGSTVRTAIVLFLVAGVGFVFLIIGSQVNHERESDAPQAVVSKHS